jgi:hypothetical protein
MVMTYILMIWTVVGFAGMSHSTATKMDWRPLGEFYNEADRTAQGFKTAKEMCEKAARELGLKTENYRCVRSK